MTQFSLFIYICVCVCVYIYIMCVCIQVYACIKYQPYILFDFEVHVTILTLLISVDITFDIVNMVNSTDI